MCCRGHEQPAQRGDLGWVPSKPTQSFLSLHLSITSLHGAKERAGSAGEVFAMLARRLKFDPCNLHKNGGYGVACL